MPIYEYSCPHCHKNFEEWLKSDDDASSHPCPACGASSPRIISQTSFILKGGGWYVTEYGSHHTESEEAPQENATDAAKDTSADAVKPTPGETKAESKADAKPAPAAPKPSETKPAPKTAPSTGGTKPVKPAAASAEA